jgi:hypothetical protein
MEEILASIRRIISEDGDGGEGGDAAAAAPKAEEAPAAEAAPADTLAAALEPPNMPVAPAVLAAAAIAAETERPKRAPIADVEAEDESDILLLTEEAIDEPPPPPSFRDSALALEDDEPPPEPPYRVPEPLTFEPEIELESEPEPIAAPARGAASEPISDLDRLISDRAAAASLAAMTELVSRSHREPNIESLPMGNANQTLEDLTRELLRPILKSWLDDNLPQIVERIVREEIGRLALDAQRR